MQRDDSHQSLNPSFLSLSFCPLYNPTTPFYIALEKPVSDIPQGTEKYRKISESTEKDRKVPAGWFQ